MKRASQLTTSLFAAVIATAGLAEAQECKDPRSPAFLHDSHRGDHAGIGALSAAGRSVEECYG